MKRGFLNSKKAKDKLLHDNGYASTIGSSAPSKQIQPSSDPAAAVSGSQVFSELVGFADFVEQIPAIYKGSILMHPHSIFRIPSLALTKSKEPSTTCIIRTLSARNITNSPGFYRPLPPQNPTDVVFTKNTSNMGVGLFAKRDIKAKEVVFSERPLLVFPPGFPFLSPLPPKEAGELQNMIFEETLQRALRAMTKEDVDAFMNLSTCLPHLPKVHGTASTNAFGTDIEKENLQEGKFGYAAIGKLASRINHNCTPNVEQKFDKSTFSLQILALRDIKAGQQLFYSYREVYRSAKERRRQLLEMYGFVCQCDACVNATPASDKIREEMNDRIVKVTEEAEEMFANPQFNVRSFGHWLKLEKEIIKEGLDFEETFVVLLYNIYLAYQKLNNIPKQTEYGRRYQNLA